MMVKFFGAIIKKKIFFYIRRAIMTQTNPKKRSNRKKSTPYRHYNDKKHSFHFGLSAFVFETSTASPTHLCGLAVVGHH